MPAARERDDRRSMPVVSRTGVDAAEIGAIVASCDALAPQLRGARLLITGATGWFGTWLLDALVALNRSAGLDLRIVAVSRTPAAFRDRHPVLHGAEEIEWLTADLLDGALPVDRTTHVLHAATDSHSAGDDALAMYETIVDGTRRVIDVAKRDRARLLIVGSGAVYGRQPAHIAHLCESFLPSAAAMACADAYTRGKRDAEYLARAAALDGLRVVVARCFAFVGPHMPFDAHFAVGNFIRDALDAPAVDVAGDGRPRRSYLYMTDLVEWLLTMLVADAPSSVYNVGSPDAIPIADLARRCVGLGGIAKPVRIRGVAQDGRDYVPDVSRAMRELQLEVRVPLDEAIARTMRWRRATPDAPHTVAHEAATAS